MKFDKYITEPIRSVVLPTDFTETASVAFAYALKAAMIAKAELDIIHASSAKGEAHGHQFPSVMSLLEKWGILEAGSPRSDVIEKLGVKINKVSAETNQHVNFTLSYIENHATDLIVIPHHSYSQKGGFFRRKSAEPIVRKSAELALFIPDKCQGFVSPETGEVSLTKILIPVDFDPDPQLAANAAMRVARAMGAENVHFQVLHVGRPGSAPRVEFSQDFKGWTLEVIEIEGDPEEVITQSIRKSRPELVVMTTAGHDGFLDALRGSTTERVLRDSRVPLLAIPNHIHLI
jgi:nucleotide-binding universal stress UspA family protein